MRNLVRASVLLLALVLSEPVLAGPLQDAHAAYQKQDYATALRLFRPLADRGNAKAQAMLGLMYALGQGVPQDHVLAAHWCRLAADQGNASGQLCLGVLYNRGTGVPLDFVEAHKWYNLSAAQTQAVNNPAAKSRNHVAEGMTPAQIAEAQKRAREWQPQ